MMKRVQFKITDKKIINYKDSFKHYHCVYTINNKICKCKNKIQLNNHLINIFEIENNEKKIQI